MKRHRILSRVLEFHAPTKAEGNRLKDGARSFWNQSLQPALERVCDECSDGVTVQRYKRVEVELRLKRGMSRAEIGEAFAEQLAAKLGGGSRNGVQAPAPGKVLDRSDIAPGIARHERVMHFLTTGRLPWNAPALSIAALAEEVNAEILASGAEWLRPLLLSLPVVATRLSRQFGGDWNQRWMRAFEGDSSLPSEILSEDVQPLSEIAATEGPVIWESRWLAWAEASSTHGAVKKLRAVRQSQAEADFERNESEIKRRDDETADKVSSRADDAPDQSGRDQAVHAPSGSPADVEKRKDLQSAPTGGEMDAVQSPADRDESKVQATSIDEPLPVQSAGLVLLGVYLPSLFERLGMVLSSNPSERVRAEMAPLLLHFAATGEVDAPESMLVLPKLLAGWPLDEPAICRNALTASDCAEVEALLSAVAGHWEALRGACVDGLRSGFLQRPGLLRETEQGWLLHVERRGWDVLIERIPWSFRMLRLSWMTKPLTVEWSAYE